MYLFYIDESGNRDVSVDEPYVLAAVGMHESRWPGFNRHLTGMKTNLARGHDPDIRQDQLEVKANLLTKPYAREDSPFFRHLTDREITHISDNYLHQLEHSKMAVIASVIEKTQLRAHMDGAGMHKKAYEMLLERIQLFMLQHHRKHNALIVMDDAGLNMNRRITLMHARMLGMGNENMEFKNIVEYPFFASSELSNGVQLADIVAYTIYHRFMRDRPDYPYMDRIVPHITRRRDEPRALAGLKVWPDTGRFGAIYDEIQSQVP